MSGQVSGVEIPETNKVSSHVVGLTFGTDPEFFFTAKGLGVIGSEKVLKDGGLIVPYTRNANMNIPPYNNKANYPDKGKFIVDGVQAELNLGSLQNTSCRASLSNSIQECFKELRDFLKTQPNIEASFVSMVDVPRSELDTLSPATRVFGCAPSKNAYEDNAEVGIDGANYTKRAAGGHIHMGINNTTGFLLTEDGKKDFVKMLDVFVGNTCVLIDRDPNQKERRLYYGRAGEYRTPPHGIEYRTPSNFWLRDYVLMSLVMGLCRIAGAAANSKYKVYPARPSWELSGKPLGYTQEQWDIYYPPENYEGGNVKDHITQILSMVDIDKVRRAINENDYELASHNFYIGENGSGGVREFIRKYVTTGSACGLEPALLPAFDYFVQEVLDRGLDGIFPKDPLDAWCDKAEGHTQGWERFLQSRTTGGLVRGTVEKAEIPVLKTSHTEVAVQGVENKIDDAIQGLTKIGRTLFRDAKGRFAKRVVAE